MRCKIRQQNYYWNQTKICGPNCFILEYNLPIPVSLRATTTTTNQQQRTKIKIPDWGWSELLLQLLMQRQAWRRSIIHRVHSGSNLFQSHDLPLYETRVVNAPVTHNLEDPPRVVGLEGVLHGGSFVQGHREAGVSAAVGDGNDAVLVRGDGSYNSPVEPGGFATSVASMDITLSVWKVFLKRQLRGCSEFLCVVKLKLIVVWTLHLLILFTRKTLYGCSI